MSDKSISLKMTMDDFVVALKQELGSVAMIFTKKEIEKRIDESVRKILEGIKEESIKIMQ